MAASELNTLLDVKEAASRLHVAPITVYRLANTRQITHNRIGDRILVPENAVKEYLARTLVSAE